MIVLTHDPTRRELSSAIERAMRASTGGPAPGSTVTSTVTVPGRRLVTVPPIRLRAFGRLCFTTRTSVSRTSPTTVSWYWRSVWTSATVLPRNREPGSTEISVKYSSPVWVVAFT